jgi:nucleoside 2-deoxyribosyltransferase
MKKRVYIAGPLFCQSELDFNLKVNDYLEKLGFLTFLPQRDGHLLSDLISEGGPKYNAIKKIFELDVDEIRKSDILVLIIDGRVPDEGACVELGIAYSLNKECIGLKTDSRYLMDNLDNPLILGAVNGRVAKSISELKKFLQ